MKIKFQFYGEEIKMRKENAIVLDWEEFDKLIGKVSNGRARISWDGTGWYYHLDDDNYDEDDEEYTLDCIQKRLSDGLGVTVTAIRTDLDARGDEVILFYK